MRLEWIHLDFLNDFQKSKLSLGLPFSKVIGTIERKKRLKFAQRKAKAETRPQVSSNASKHSQAPKPLAKAETTGPPAITNSRADLPNDSLSYPVNPSKALGKEQLHRKRPHLRQDMTSSSSCPLSSFRRELVRPTCNSTSSEVNRSAGIACPSS